MGPESPVSTQPVRELRELLQGKRLTADGLRKPHLPQHCCHSLPGDDTARSSSGRASCRNSRAATRNTRVAHRIRQGLPPLVKGCADDAEHSVGIFRFYPRLFTAPQPDHTGAHIGTGDEAVGRYICNYLGLSVVLNCERKRSVILCSRPCIYPRCNLFLDHNGHALYQRMSLRGIFLKKLRARYDAAANDEERRQIEQAARWGLAALNNAEEVVQHEDP